MGRVFDIFTGTAKEEYVQWMLVKIGVLCAASQDPPAFDPASLFGDLDGDPYSALPPHHAGAGGGRVDGDTVSGLSVASDFSVLVMMGQASRVLYGSRAPELHGEEEFAMGDLPPAPPLPDIDDGHPDWHNLEMV